MPRNKKPSREPNCPDKLKVAVELVVKDNFTLRKASERTGIAFQTIARYVDKYRKKDGDIDYEPVFKSTILDDRMEQEMVQYITKCSKMNYGLTLSDARKLAFDLAEANSVKMPPNWVREKMAGRDWISSFMKRHPLSLRKPEGCSLARNTAFNRENVGRFYQNLKEVYEKYAAFSDGTRVYNLDETGITTVATPPKVISAKGQRQVAQVQAAERGSLVTVCSIISAAGTALPPAMIFPRKNFVQRMIAGAPPGTLGLAAQSPWMTGELFVQVLHHFVNFSGSTKDNPTLLILDNHQSHLAPEVLQLAKQHGVVLLTLPPHCTHKLQPLDVGVFGPFMTYYNQAISNFHMNHPGQRVDIYNLAEFVGQAHQKSMTPKNIQSSFQKVGIVPYRDDVFTEDDFLTELQSTNSEMTEEVTAEGSAGEGTSGDADIYPTGATSNVQTPVSSRETEAPAQGRDGVGDGPSSSKTTHHETPTTTNKSTDPRIQDERTKKAHVTPEAVRPFPSTSTDASSKPKRKTKKLKSEVRNQSIHLIPMLPVMLFKQGRTGTIC